MCKYYLNDAVFEASCGKRYNGCSGAEKLVLQTSEEKITRISTDECKHFNANNNANPAQILKALGPNLRPS
jgi:hypothetical protein